MDCLGAYLRCRTLALAYVLYRDLHDPSLKNVQKNLDTVRAVGKRNFFFVLFFMCAFVCAFSNAFRVLAGFDITGNPDTCPSYDPGFDVGVFYVDQLVLAGLGTLIPIILLAKHAKKVTREKRERREREEREERERRERRREREKREEKRDSQICGMERWTSVIRTRTTNNANLRSTASGGSSTIGSTAGSTDPSSTIE